MKKGIIIIFLSFITTWATPNTMTKKTWYIGGKDIEFVRSSSGHIHMSSNCIQNSNCLALKSQKLARHISLTDIDLRGGKSPGSVLCIKLNGNNIKGKNNKGKISFCRFPDESYIESSLLNR